MPNNFKVVPWRMSVTIAYAKCSPAQCDLDLQISDIVLARNIFTCLGDHLCSIIFKSRHARQNFSRTPACACIAYAQKSSDLDLQANVMVFARNTSSSHVNYLCQIILKFYYAGQRYVSDISIGTQTQTNKHTHTRTHGQGKY